MMLKCMYVCDGGVAGIVEWWRGGDEKGENMGEERGLVKLFNQIGIYVTVIKTLY